MFQLKFDVIRVVYQIGLWGHCIPTSNMNMSDQTLEQLIINVELRTKVQKNVTLLGFDHVSIFKSFLSEILYMEKNS